MTAALGFGVAELFEGIASLVVTGGQHSFLTAKPPAGTSTAELNKVKAAVAQLQHALSASTRDAQWLQSQLTASNQSAEWATAYNVAVIAYQTIPTTRAQANRQATLAYEKAVADTTARVKGANSSLLKDIAAAREYTHILYGTAINYSRSLHAEEGRALLAQVHTLQAKIATVQHAATALTNLVKTDLTNLVNFTRADIEREFAAADATVKTYAADQANRARLAADTYTDVQIGDLITKENADMTQALQGVWGEFTDQISQLKDELATDDPAAAKDISTLSDLVPHTAPLAAVAAIAAVTSLLRTTLRCTIPQCRNLSKFGKDLAALMSLVGDASFLALLIELAKNPTSGAQAVHDIFTPITDTATTAIRDLIGI